MSLLPPILTLLDPVVASEGSVDPLSLQRTYENLADAIMPAVTVRMGRIRFVTAMCLGALVCQDYDDDDVASDGVTPPWLVYEWFVIEAFARSDEETRGENIPGLQKVRSTLEAQRPVSAPAYLKTPKVFGFSGVFRRLAVASRILDSDLRLDDGGWEILRAWEKEQNLPGLVQGRQGAGAELVRELRDAVAKGMSASHTVTRPADFWSRIARHLHPSDIGKQEGRVVLKYLLESSDLTKEHLTLLSEHGARVDREHEPGYLRGIRGTCSPALAALLGAIDAYEALCQPIAESFDILRELSTHRSCGPIAAIDLSNHTSIPQLVAHLAEGCTRASADAYLLDRHAEVRDLIDVFERVNTGTDLFDALVTYHEAAQAKKPPDGKRAWLEHARGNAVMVRTAYALPERATGFAYVHDYRTTTLCRFLADTGVLS